MHLSSFASQTAEMRVFLSPDTRPCHRYNYLTMPMRSYYGKNGSYLKEHAEYFTDDILNRDVDFLIKSLALTKRDKCLDLQCAQGRLTIELITKGYDIDGLDSSSHMLELAKTTATRKNLVASFIKGDLNNLDLPRIYTKVFMYFPDWDGIRLENVLNGVAKTLKPGGLFLFDQDNLYRIWNYLAQNPQANFKFNAQTMELVEKGKTSGNRYYVFPELHDQFKRAGFKIIRTYGGWYTSEGIYRYNSPRLRIVAKKNG